MKSVNRTSLRKTQPRRRYEDACAAAHALDLVGDRWALLVMRELMPGPRRLGAIYGGQPLQALAADGVLSIDGGRALAERFVTSFRLPSKFAGPA